MTPRPDRSGVVRASRWPADYVFAQGSRGGPGQLYLEPDSVIFVRHCPDLPLIVQVREKGGTVIRNLQL
jgi:hypothetical protein